MYMEKNSYKFIAELSRLILLLLINTGLCILSLVCTMRDCGELFLRAYNSVPLMLEYVLAGVVLYLVFEVLAEKLVRQKIKR